jgi:hypothetical protein
MQSLPQLTLSEAEFSSQLWKTSCFVWVRNSIATNDLTDEQTSLTQIEHKILAQLKVHRADAHELSARLEQSPELTDEVLHRLVERGVVVPADEDESRKFSVKRVDIEISSHCNARCQYCPVSTDPKPKRVMSMELFEHIARQIAPYRPEWVSLNSFSEPLLDPFFVERCRYLEECGLKVALFTNATILRTAIREYLHKSKVLHSIVINFASEDPEEWGELMGLSPASHSRTVENIVGLAEAFPGPISISVHGHNDTHQRRTNNIAGLFARYPHVSVLQFATNTMAGNINGELVGLPTLTDALKLAGCNRLASHLQISWCADVFMCCLDYFQEVKFGNLAEASIQEILGGAVARQYRRQVYGLEKAGPNLLCRKCCHIRVEV